jgi:hypothetical protein
MEENNKFYAIRQYEGDHWDKQWAIDNSHVFPSCIDGKKMEVPEVFHIDVVYRGRREKASGLSMTPTTGFTFRKMLMMC